MSELNLSVLDLVPVRTDQDSSDAVAASLSLARTADELGYRRYWLAEHHNMPAVAATNPPVLIGLVAAHRDEVQDRQAEGVHAVFNGRHRTAIPPPGRHDGRARPSSGWPRW